MRADALGCPGPFDRRLFFAHALAEEEVVVDALNELDRDVVGAFGRRELLERDGGRTGEILPPRLICFHDVVGHGDGHPHRIAHMYVVDLDEDEILSDAHLRVHAVHEHSALQGRMQLGFAHAHTPAAGDGILGNSIVGIQSGNGGADRNHDSTSRFAFMKGSSAPDSSKE